MARIALPIHHEPVKRQALALATVVAVRERILSKVWPLRFVLAVRWDEAP